MFFAAIATVALSCIKHNTYIYLDINEISLFPAERSSNTFSSDTGALWLPFQTAAGTVTTLYKGGFKSYTLSNLA